MARFFLSGIVLFGAYWLAQMTVPALYATGIDIPNIEIAPNMLVYAISIGTAVVAFLKMD